MFEEALDLCHDLPLPLDKYMFTSRYEHRLTNDQNILAGRRLGR